MKNDGMGKGGVAKQTNISKPSMKYFTKRVFGLSEVNRFCPITEAFCEIRIAYELTLAPRICRLSGEVLPIGWQVIPKVVAQYNYSHVGVQPTRPVTFCISGRWLVQFSSSVHCLDTSQYIMAYFRHAVNKDVGRRLQYIDRYLLCSYRLSAASASLFSTVESSSM